jgi:hypothetical protein
MLKLGSPMSISDGDCTCRSAMLSAHVDSDAEHMSIVVLQAPLLRGMASLAKARRRPACLNGDPGDHIQT